MMENLIFIHNNRSFVFGSIFFLDIYCPLTKLFFVGFPCENALEQDGRFPALTKKKWGRVNALK